MKKTNKANQAKEAGEKIPYSANTVTVAFNSPRGIIFTVGTKNIHISGNNHHLIGKEKGILSVGKYGYTRIAKEEWEAIQASYGSMDIFKNNVIFAEANKERSEDKAAELEEIRHGLEPVDTKTARTEEAQVTAV